MSKTVLAPVSKEEAELANVARMCVEAALDHSRADVIEVRVATTEDAQDRAAPVIKVPPAALRLFALVLRQMAKREPVVLMHHKHEFSTQEAANLLRVSRPFVIKEIDAGRLKCRLVNKHRRIELEELRRYEEQQKRDRETALQELSSLSEEYGLEP